MSQRLTWYTSEDSVLLAQCDVDTYRASGPGGQKRNKTSSAVRLRHGPSGLVVIAEESRSQHENKAKALRRLRQAFCLKLRETPAEPFDTLTALRDSGGRLHAASSRDPRYWPAVAVLLDLLDVHAARVSDVAERVGTTTANVLSILELDPRAWEQANILRQKHGQKPLKA